MSNPNERGGLDLTPSSSLPNQWGMAQNKTDGAHSTRQIQISG